MINLLGSKLTENVCSCDPTLATRSNQNPGQRKVVPKVRANQFNTFMRVIAHKVNFCRVFFLKDQTQGHAPRSRRRPRVTSSFECERGQRSCWFSGLWKITEMGSHLSRVRSPHARVTSPTPHRPPIGFWEGVGEVTVSSSQRLPYPLRSRPNFLPI